MAKNPKFQKFSCNLKSPNSYVYTRPVRKNNQLSSEIFYSLSSTEHYKESLKTTALPANVRDRQSFLNGKYQTKPAERYAFPIATSMRIGWFQT